MSARQYDQITASLPFLFANDGRLDDVSHITDDPTINPTAEQCPAISVDLKSFNRDPKRLTAMIRSASPYDEHVYVTVKVWTFDLEGAGPARKRNADLCRRVMDVVADNPTLNGTVDYAGVHRGDFNVLAANGGGIFACAELSIECWTQS